MKTVINCFISNRLGWIGCLPAKQGGKLSYKVLELSENAVKLIRKIFPENILPWVTKWGAKYNSGCTAQWQVNL